MQNKLTLAHSKKPIHMVDKSAFRDAQMLARSAKRNSKGFLADLQWAQAMLSLTEAYGL